MRIDTSQVALQSQHSASVTDSRQERLRYWIGDANPAQGQLTRPTAPALPVNKPGVLDRIELSLEMLRRLSEGPRAVLVPSTVPAPTKTEYIQPAGDDGTPLETDAKMIVAKGLLEALTGKEITIRQPDIKATDSTAAPDGADEAGKAPENEGENRPQRAGWGLDYRYDAVHDEREQTSFAAQGRVTTADGREIDFALKTEMTRAYHTEEHISVQAGDAVVKDPLILNFGGPAGALTEERVQLDLNADGKAEAMPFAGPSSGFLVYDRDNDGTVDDGSELFGPTTSDGFAELAALDADRNGWLDEADPAYAQLKVWTRDGGGGSVVSLQQRQVGAIYVGSTATPFSVRDAKNEVLGQMQESGVFLYEDGRAGAVQRVDVKV